jgi:hypothetical protein
MFTNIHDKAQITPRPHEECPIKTILKEVIGEKTLTDIHTFIKGTMKFAFPMAHHSHHKNRHVSHHVDHHKKHSSAWNMPVFSFPFSVQPTSSNPMWFNSIQMPKISMPQML